MEARFMYNGLDSADGGGGYDHGPFNANVWEYWGYVDPWGLPKIKIWQTTFAGGQAGLAIQLDNEHWVFMKGKTSGGVLIGLNALKSAYKYAEVIKF